MATSIIGAEKVALSLREGVIVTSKDIGEKKMINIET